MSVVRVSRTNAAPVSAIPSFGAPQKPAFGAFISSLPAGGVLETMPAQKELYVGEGLEVGDIVQIWKRDDKPVFGKLIEKPSLNVFNNSYSYTFIEAGIKNGVVDISRKINFDDTVSSPILTFHVLGEVGKTALENMLVKQLHQLSEKEFVEHAFAVSKFIHNDVGRNVDFFVRQKENIDALVAAAVEEGELNMLKKIFAAVLPEDSDLALLADHLKAVIGRKEASVNLVNQL